MCIGPITPQNRAGQNYKQIEKERTGRVKEKPCSHGRRQTLDAEQNLSSRPQPHDDTQIHRNGLTEDGRAS